MRKNTKGRRIQHFPAVAAREAVAAFSYKKKVENDKNKSGYSTVTVKVPAVPAVKARRGKAIKHSPNRPSPAMIIGRSNNDTKIVAFVRWQDCAGAKRRGWS